jgi:ribose 5-phosphate isomerase B
MRIVIGADHAGFELKQILAAYLRHHGHEVIDKGTDSDLPVDYPDFAEAVGDGVGASVSANKIPGIRAGLCHDSYSAHQGVEHDDMNILVLGARIIGVEVARELVDRFLAAKFNGEERHRRRVDKISALERRYAKTA